MSDRPNDIELKAGEYRQTFRGPLENPRTLVIGLLFFAVGALGGAWAAHTIGTFWAAFIPIPSAFGLGLFAAGMWPNWFFGRDRT